MPRGGRRKGRRTKGYFFRKPPPLRYELRTACSGSIKMIARLLGSAIAGLLAVASSVAAAGEPAGESAPAQSDARLTHIGARNGGARAEDF
jgi:hypothetical protein